jgi:hypothetical protein
MPTFSTNQPVIVLLVQDNTTFAESVKAYRAKARKLGAVGFVSKENFPAALLPLLESLHA